MAASGAHRFNPLKNFEPLSPTQLDEYLSRIHLDLLLPVDPTLEVLNRVLYAHASHIPFENGQLRFLDLKPSLQLEELFERVVTNKRGGYCFQVNSLLISALRSLGFNATAGVGRSCVWDPLLPGHTLGSTTHQIVFVELDEKLYLADMGYNQIGLTCAVEVAPGVEVDCAADEKHQITNSDYTGPGNFMVRHKRAEWSPLADGVDPEGDKYSPLFYFTKERYRPQDYEVFNYFVSHSPVHIMMRTFIASIVTATGGRAVIIDRKFKRREGKNHRDLEKVV
ncbi:hypothetical protein BDR26DRAFT_856997, partial [Obelidium mucronatum]